MTTTVSESTSTAMALEVRNAVSSRVHGGSRIPTANIIGFCGKKRSGKDTAASAFVDQFQWVKIGFSDALKEGALRIDPIVGFRTIEIDSGKDEIIPVRLSEVVNSVGWDEAKKNPEVRRFLQRYGTEGGRQVFGDDCWTKIAKQRIRVALVKHAGVVIPDVRFENELQLIHDMGGIVFEIVRDDAARREADGGGGDGGNDRHVSEDVPFTADKRIHNAGSRALLQDTAVVRWENAVRLRPESSDSF